MLKLIGGLFLVMTGCLLLLIGINLRRRSFRLIRTGVRATGRVIGFDHPDPESDQLMNVAFTDQFGVERYCQLSTDRGASNVVGQPISLIYDGANPTHVVGTTYDQLWFKPNLICWLGGILVSLGVGTIVSE